MMRHKDTSTGKIYDHEEIGWSRIAHVAKTVRRQLWPKTRPMAGKPQPTTEPTMRVVGDDAEQVRAA